LVFSEIQELRKQLEARPVERPKYVNHLSEIERLIYDNSRLEDEIAELQRKEEEVITNRWW